MSKKYEFKPDKPQITLLNKLYITATQRKIILKWFLYAMVLLVLSVLQDVIFSRVRIFGATTDLVPCAILLICVLQGSETGGVFALVAAAMYRFSGTSPGDHVIVLLPALGIFAAILRQSYLRKGFSANALCVCVAMMLYELILFVICLLFSRTSAERIGAFLLAGAFSLVLIPVLYPIAMAIDKVGGETWKE